MRAHLHKDEFKFVAVSVMVLEVAAFLIFIFGTLSAILLTYSSSGIQVTDFILFGFGGIFVALVLMALAEMLQLIMRIEHNTRKENALIRKQTQIQEAEVKATKSVAAALRKTTARKARKPVRRKAAIKKPRVRKVKARKR